MTDTRTPAEIAEEERDEAHRMAVVLEHAYDRAEPDGVLASLSGKWHKALDRAMKAARWAQHEFDCRQCGASNVLPECQVGDRLRREYEGVRDGQA